GRALRWPSRMPARRLWSLPMSRAWRRSPRSILPKPAVATPWFWRPARTPGGAPACRSSPPLTIRRTSIASTFYSSRTDGTRATPMTRAGTSPGKWVSSPSSTRRSAVLSALPARVEGAGTPGSMKQSPRVDDDGLAGHGISAAHRHDHVGTVVLVGGLLQQCTRRGALDLLGSKVGSGARALQKARCHAIDERLRRQCHGHAAGEVDEACL